MPGKNPLLKRLGFNVGDRVAVLHADDIGMCEATVAAYRKIAPRGIVSAASAMVPCGWFPAVAQWCREHASIADMGVHLTLNSEWKGCRWGPLTGNSAAGLTDEFGYFHESMPAVHQGADENAIYVELCAQIDRALALGLDVSHIDSHMITLNYPALIDVYMRLSRKYRLPGAILASPYDDIHFRQTMDAARREGLMVFDFWATLPLDKNSHKKRLDKAKRILDELPEGFSFIMSHPAIDCPELRAIASDWPARVADYELYLSAAWAKAIEASGIKVIGMRQIRDRLFPRKNAK